MQIANVESTVVRDGVFTEKSFGIKDEVFVFEMLSSRLYSDAVITICQEIGCNARDAHREMGKDDIPVDIKLPNPLDPRFIIRDYGPGITTERMNNVFIFLGASTKRDDNVQTGGFGIGAKTPWAYTDQFGIVTITPEEVYEDTITGQVHKNVLVKRTYNAYKNEKKMGMLALMCEEVTKEPQGTSIIITSKPEHFNKFAQGVRRACDYWDTRPNVTGCDNFEWTSLEKDFEGEDWEVLKNPNRYDNGFNSRPLAIVDGIPYSLNERSLDLSGDADLSKIFQYPARIYFKTGQVQLTANREEIDYERTNKDYVVKRLKEVVEGIRIEVQKDVANCSNLWEANVKWREDKRGYTRIVSAVNWNGKKVTGEPIITYRQDCKVYHFTKRTDRDGVERIRRVNSDSGVIEFEKDSIFCIEDSQDNNPSRARALTLFIQNPNCLRVQVLVYPTDPTKKDAAVKALEDNHFISLMNPIMLSTVVKSRIRNAAGSGARAIKAKKFINGYSRRGSWQDEEIDMATDDGYYVLLDRYNATMPVSGKSISDQLLKILKEMGIEIYGFHKAFINKWQKTSQQEDLPSDWIPIDTFIAEKIVELQADATFMASYNNTQDQYNGMSHTCSHVNDLMSKNSFTDLIEDKGGVVFQYYNASKLVQKSLPNANNNMDMLTTLCGAMGQIPPVKKLTIDLAKLASQFAKKYPLLSRLGYYGGGGEATSKHIAAYINMCDKE